MAIQADKTAQLDAASAASRSPIQGAQVVPIFKRLNAQEELIKDVACQGGGAGGSQTYDGHNHDGNGNGRGILRCVCGYFQLGGDASAPDLPMTSTISLRSPVSMAVDSSFTGVYQASTSPCALNYIMGKAWISAGITEFRVEVCAKIESLDYKPRLRIKNLTDTISPAEANLVYASNWIYLDSTSPKWYGEDVAEKLTVPVLKSTGQREIDIDIEVSAEDLDDWSGTDTIDIMIYAAFPYEYVNED